MTNRMAIVPVEMTEIMKDIVPDICWPLVLFLSPNSGLVTKAQSDRVLEVFEELVSQQLDADSAMATALNVALGLEIE